MHRLERFRRSHAAALEHDDDDLVLSEMDLGPNACAVLCEWLLSQDNATYQLETTEDKAGDQRGGSDVEASEEREVVNIGVKRLILGCNNLGDDGVQNLCDLLRHNVSVTELDLRSNGISPAGVELLVEVVPC